LRKKGKALLLLLLLLQGRRRVRESIQSSYLMADGGGNGAPMFSRKRYWLAAVSYYTPTMRKYNNDVYVSMQHVAICLASAEESANIL
jgi:hypothetical protein